MRNTIKRMKEAASHSGERSSMCFKQARFCSSPPSACLDHLTCASLKCRSSNVLLDDKTMRFSKPVRFGWRGVAQPSLLKHKSRHPLHAQLSPLVPCVFIRVQSWLRPDKTLPDKLSKIGKQTVKFHAKTDKNDEKTKTRKIRNPPPSVGPPRLSTFLPLG